MPETVLITGASRGIGRALALAADARGDDVIATMRRPDLSDLPAGIEVRHLEVTKVDGNKALADSLGGRPLDVLICNAGVFPGRGGLREADYSELDWFAGLMTNVAGPFFAVRALLPNLRSAGSPRVAIVASKMGSSTLASGGSYIYRTSKAAAVNLARNLAVELKPLGIAVGAYHPGWVRTDLGTEAGPMEPVDSAEGLLERIDALSLETSGVFEDYSGEPLPF